MEKLMEPNAQNNLATMLPLKHAANTPVKHRIAFLMVLLTNFQVGCDRDGNGCGGISGANFSQVENAGFGGECLILLQNILNMPTELLSCISKMWMPQS